jgi:protein O-mannosyl-transferase
MKSAKTIHVLILALMTIIVFASHLNNDFVWDDKFLVTDNPYIKNWSHLPEIFTTQLYAGKHTHSDFYRPLQLVSFTLDHMLWGLKPFGYHLTSLLIHVSNVILVYVILTVIGPSTALALMAASFFAVSPPISGITYYISARSDLLMAFFLLVSFLSFVRYRMGRRRIFYILSILAFIFSFLSKEMGLILVAVLALEIFREGKKSARDIMYILPYLIISVIYIVIRSTVLNFNKGLSEPAFAATIPFWGRMLTDVKIIPKYIGLFLFPYGLHMDWFVAPEKNLLRPGIIYSFFACLVIFFAAWRLSHRSGYAARFGFLWFLVCLLPVLNIYPISVFFGEGWLYLPSIGFYTAVAAVFVSIVFPKTGKKIGSMLAGCVVIYYSLFTFNYGRVWKDGVSLFENVLKYEKESPFVYSVYNNLGVSHYDKGEIKESIKYYKKSIAADPTYENPYNNLGAAYIELNEPVRAIGYFRKAINIKKNYPDAYLNLSKAYRSIGYADKAAETALAVIEINPYFYKAYLELGYIYMDKGENGKAAGFFETAVQLKRSDPEPRYGLGSVYLKQNRFDIALEQYEKAVELDIEENSKFYNEIGFLYLKNGKIKEAERSLLRSISLDPGRSEPHNNLGNLYSVFGYFKPAMIEYRKALALDPQSGKISDNLMKTKAQWKKALKQD